MEIVEGKKEKTLKDEATDEVREEILKKAKEDLKKKMRALYDAKVIVSNLEREIRFVEEKLEQELKDIL